jgi:hypothetical protein
MVLFYGELHRDSEKELSLKQSAWENKLLLFFTALTIVLWNAKFLSLTFSPACLTLPNCLFFSLKLP